MSKLMLYVWEEDFCDYTCGLAVVLAENTDQAKPMVSEKLGMSVENAGEPVIYEIDKPVGFAVYGGG